MRIFNRPLLFVRYAENGVGMNRRDYMGRPQMIDQNHQ